MGLGLLICGITYGIQPYGGDSMGWTNPWVVAMLGSSIALLFAFVSIEARTDDPMFHTDLFRIPVFAFGNLAGLLAAISRGGLQLILIIWLQGIWLPHRGFSYESAPVWVASGMRMTFMNAGNAVSIGAFFSLMVIGLSATLPAALSTGLVSEGVPDQAAAHLSALPPVGILFATFLGINPIATLLAPTGLLQSLPAMNVTTLTGSDFFPTLISSPFHGGLVLVFAIAALMMMVVAAIASWFAGGARTAGASSVDSGERTGEEPRDYALTEGGPQ